MATRASAQSTCPVPLAIKPKAGGVAPNYGYLVGEWVNMYRLNVKRRKKWLSQFIADQAVAAE